MSEPTWRVVAASTIGTSHLRAGGERQDRFGYQLHVDDNGDEALVITVSDGAGSCSRSEIGADITCTVLLNWARRILASGVSLVKLNENNAIEAVNDALSALQTRADEDNLPVREYGCTALLAILKSREAFFLQRGDGLMVVRETNEPATYSHVFDPQIGEFAGSTYFVTSEWADQEVLFAVKPRRFDEVMVMTDGIQDLAFSRRQRAVHGPFAEALLSPLRRRDAFTDEDLVSALESFLESDDVITRTDDDKTVVLATRLGEAASMRNASV
jgi:hypothetical protein